MSSQKGNVTRSRPQKHQNTFTFKNDKFDKSVQTKPTGFRKFPSPEVCREYDLSVTALINRTLFQFRVEMKINAKLHDGVCQRCKEVLEWRVKYSKYKPLSKPKKWLTGSVKCLQKTVKDSYHIMCRPCACELEVCAKCGKKEEIVIPFNKEPETSENTENEVSNHRRSCKRKEDSDEDFDAESDSDGEDGDTQA
ncbi:hypothetical protein APTSU1_001751100 [Apodemus speciosus]|uniref:Recombination activating protein 1 n=1 Tax=Apodemus speciosus TaxID=105296 RepID=A0ABQ0FSP3_APOSI